MGCPKRQNSVYVKRWWTLNLRDVEKMNILFVLAFAVVIFFSLDGGSDILDMDILLKR